MKEKTHIAIPRETFNKVMNTIGQLPFVQVSQIFEEVRNSLVPIDLEDEVKQPPEKRE